MDTNATVPESSQNAWDVQDTPEPPVSGSLLSRISRTRVYAFEDAASKIKTANVGFIGLNNIK